MAARQKIAIAAIRQVRSEMPEVCCLLGFDFVELVPTNFSNFLVLRKEVIVDRHHEFLKWSDYGIVDIVRLQELICVWRSGIDSLDVTLALDKLQTVSPDVAWVTH